MDNRFNQTSTNNHPASQQPLTPLSALSTQSFQQQTDSSHTLPPIQSQYAVPPLSQSIPRQFSAPSTPRTPHTPGPASASSHSGHFPYIAPQPPPTRVQQSQTSYPPLIQPLQGHQAAASSSSNYLPPQSVALAPRPAQSQLPLLQPMPAGGFNQQTSSHSAFPPVSLLPEAHSLTATDPHPFPNNDHGIEPQPTHVVGSQGRRGILPSAPGRAAAVTGGAGTAARNATIPPKDADGKFPCPHCNKTYLHAKHLKRHLLRHTGDRPYMCILCRDTFSRSDILKRHFQKCSLRRGNPTGASHLSHSHAHLRKSHPGPHRPPGSNVGISQPSSSTSGINGFGMTSFSPALGSLPSMAPHSAEPFGGRGSDQNHLRDSNGIHRADASVGYSKEEIPVHGSDETRRGTLTESSDESAQASPSGTENPNTTSHYSQNFGFDPESSVDSFIKGTDSLSFKQAQLPSFNGPQPNKGNELDWPNLYLPNGSDEYSDHPIFPSQLAQPQMKADSDIHMGTFGTMDEHANHLLHGLYATPLTLGTAGLPNTFSNWNLDSVDPLQRKADRLIAFCSMDGPGSLATEKNALRKLLTVDNFRHFVEKFTNFQGHWPMIHMPTFDLMEAYDGLVLAIICIGAIYSERPSPGEVRILMEHSKRAIERSSEVYGLVSGGTEAADNSPKSFESATSIDELQSLTLLQILCVWHGDPNHRESARNNFAIIALLARKTGLLQLAEPGKSAYSVLHQHGATDEDLKADFNWLVWVEQEKRIRLMFGIWLLDVALIQYFNDFPAKFNAFEVRIPLPADDTTWDAKDPGECAVSLGLNGPEAQKISNVTGSRLKKQPLFHHALKTLLEPTYNFQPRSTNVYSKFILIHALLADIFKAQRTAILSGNHDFGGSGTTTPINEISWVHVSDEDNGPSNGQSTPIGADSHRLLKSTSQALAKWKKAWDTDIALQYPPSTYNYRRFGFCRDGVHFYWLAVALLRGNRAADVQLSADARFIQVMKMLKNVKNWAASDGAQRGEEIGSVGDIDESYGVDSITLDMKKLFTPIGTFDSPVSGVQTNLGT